MTFNREGEKAGPELSNLVDGEGDAGADRASITDAHGTVARFEMSYSPPAGERISFGPPLRQTWPAYSYLTFALGLIGTVVVGHYSSHNSPLYIWVVEGDVSRPLSAATLAFIVFVSALATVVRSHMRGVIVHSDGLEARYLMLMGVPRIKKWRWAQIERMVLDESRVLLELWDGTYEALPDVANVRKLSELLERIAAGRKMRITTLPQLERAST
jgi:hypothetical protein